MSASTEVENFSISKLMDDMGHLESVSSLSSVESTHTWRERNKRSLYAWRDQDEKSFEINMLGAKESSPNHGSISIGSAETAETPKYFKSVSSIDTNQSSRSRKGSPFITGRNNDAEEDSITLGTDAWSIIEKNQEVVTRSMFGPDAYDDSALTERNLKLFEELEVRHSTSSQSSKSSNPMRIQTQRIRGKKHAPIRKTSLREKNFMIQNSEPVWRKRWEREVKQHRDVTNNDARTMLISRLRKEATETPLPHRPKVDYSRVYCLFETIFSQAWHKPFRKHGNILSALEYQANELAAFRDRFDVHRSAKLWSSMVICVSNRKDISSIVRDCALKWVAGRKDVKNLSFLQFNERSRSMEGGGFWNVLWTWGRPNIDFSMLLAWQRVNHFPGSMHLTRKDLMKRHIDWLSSACGGEFKLSNPFRSMLPETYILPEQRRECVRAMDACRSGTLWIVKPTRLSRGRGIYLIDSSLKVPSSKENFVISRYIEKPLLLDGYKFDLRMYVLATSFQPLEAFVYQRGFARLASVKYSTGSIDNPFVHLTNSSIQKKNIKHQSNPYAHRGACKIPLQELLNVLREEYKINTSDLMDNISTIILSSLIAIEHKIPPNMNCFELFGYDIIIDENLKPWLIEVNSSPSLAHENITDKRIKTELLTDILNIVSPQPYDRKSLSSLFHRRMRSGQWTRMRPRSKIDLRQQLNAEFSRILYNDSLPRPFGTMPKVAGRFNRIAPSKIASKLLAFKRKFVANKKPINKIKMKKKPRNKVVSPTRQSTKALRKQSNSSRVKFSVSSPRLTRF